jgi:hypothetical protein
LLILVHPASFFLVASYSESLFLMSMLGFFYWSDRTGRLARLLAVLHGFPMTATRIVGLPLTIYPLVQSWLRDGGKRLLSFRQKLRQSIAPALIAGCTALGALLFLAFCQWRFGDWQRYMKTEQVGWCVHPDYVGCFSRKIFSVHWPHRNEGFIDPEFVSRLSVPAMLLGFVIVILLAVRLHRPRWREQLGLLLCAGFLYYISVSGHCTRGMSSMVRFSLCVQVSLALVLVHLLAHAWPIRHSLKRRLWRRALIWMIGSLILQFALTYRFTHGKWVA